ncbi:MazG-like family protein [Clostridiaceae bacterium M8S5]|nr:MazG-like family protein [Clostridiaceae bacterium M8S5]
MKNDVDITKNIKVIEWLKCELLSSISSLYESLMHETKQSREVVIDVLANIIFVTYLLGKRLGIPFQKLDAKIKSKIKLKIVEEHKIEKWYGELSVLLEHFNRKDN